MALSPGTRLGPYEIIATIGAGGMGEVYRARDTRLQRDVAIKVLPPAFAEDRERLGRFEHEARTASALNHPNILTIFEIAESASGPYIVSELVAGETLRAKLRRHPEGLVVEEGIEIAAQIASGLATAHDAGIVHRDIKPENIVIRPDGLVKILDFGLAKSSGSSALAEDCPTGAGHTVPGMISGTVRYMSPEQARGLPVDLRSDVFSFGIVLYEMLTGAQPFTGDTTTDVLVSIVDRQPAPCSRLRPQLSSAVERVVSRCLEKKKERRYDSGQSLRTELKALVGGSSTQVPAVTAPPSIAVLPFADMSPLRDLDYFCEGIAEELINAFGKIQQLRVASRTAAFRFKGAEDIQTFGDKLGVATVLEGSVRTAGTRLRVTAQLVSVADGYQLWSERFDRSMEDVFDVQDEIVLAIVGSLKVKLLGEEKAAVVKRQTNNVEAYHLCLRARYHFYRWTQDAFNKAVTLFEQALQLDPAYALAHFGLGDCQNAAAFMGLLDPGTQPRVAALLERAVELDPSLAEGHAILGINQGLWGWRWAEADRSFVRAMEANPLSPHACSAYGEYLLKSGRADRSMALAKRAVEIDPLVSMWVMGVALTHYGLKEYREAIAQAQMTLELDSGYWWAHAITGLSAAALGDMQQALSSIEKAVSYSGDLPYVLGWWGYIQAKAGLHLEAEQKLRQMTDQANSGYFSAVAIAIVCCGLGRPDACFDWLERAFQQHDPQLAFHLTSASVLDDVRADARFADLRNRLGLPA